MVLFFEEKIQKGKKEKENKRKWGWARADVSSLQRFERFSDDEKCTFNFSFQT